MEEVVDNNNENYEIDEDRLDSRITINGHCNKVAFTCQYVKELYVLGHNNYFHGEGSTIIGKLVVLGHNNSIRNLKSKKIQVIGHNNTCKNLKTNSQIVNKGTENKFINCG